MAIELTIAGSQSVAARYFGWVPVRCELRDPAAARAVDVTVTQRATMRSGRLRFGTTRPESRQLALRVPAGGQPVTFVVAGEFGRPSRSDGDVRVEIADRQGQRLTAFPAMVRVRKDANALEPAERDRFLRAMAALNDHGRGVFRAFRDTHTIATSQQAHGDAAFLPWHRAFVLDLERELQRVDPSVTLPYWRFHAPAPRVFTAEFMGAMDPAARVVRFAASNPLVTWSTDGRLGVDRDPRFDTRTEFARVRVGERAVTTFRGPFGRLTFPLEGDPHGAAHTSFAGFLSNLETAARDPLFYMLHCNVDRLWATWQWTQRRMDAGQAASFNGGQPVSDGSRPPGHNLGDTMWPWNNVRTAPRPPIAPRQRFPAAPGVPAPAAKPTVRSMIDYQGVHRADARLGFDYDDVPFQP